MEEKMALPIAPTPKLGKEASEKFIKRVNRDLKNPVGPVPTPKLNEAIRMIKTDATREAK